RSGIKARNWSRRAVIVPSLWSAQDRREGGGVEQRVPPGTALFKADYAGRAARGYMTSCGSLCGEENSESGSMIAGASTVMKPAFVTVVEPAELVALTSPV